MQAIIDFLKAVDSNADEAPQALLDRILRECRAYTAAEAGTIFLVRRDAGRDTLEAMSLQNDALDLEPMQFVLDIDPSSIAGYVAVTGETLLIPDAYDIPSDRPYRFNASFDEASGYRTGSVACIALRRGDGEVCAVVQLINRRDAAGAALPFDADQADFIAAAGIVISGVIERAEMVDRLARQNDELREQYRTIESLQAETATALVEARKSARAKTEFLNCIGHELKTPLNAVIGFAELLRNEGFGPLGHPSYRNFAVDITDAGHKLLRMVSDILSIVSAESNVRTLRDDWRAAYACVEDTTRAHFEFAAEANLVLAAEIADGPCSCAVDRHALQTALERLLDNAVKFTPAGGEVVVTVGPAPNGALEIEIADTGIGMTPDDIARALAPFGQADSSLARRYEGAGLGLTLADALVRGMGGRLTVDSAPEAGTRIRLAFPVRVPETAPGIREPVSARS